MSEAHENQERGAYDVVVLGAGPVGTNVADRARAAGLTTAVVERELVGGECAYWACVPSKALLRPVIALTDAHRVDGARQAVTDRPDTGRVFARRNHYVNDWDDTGQGEWVKAIGTDLYRGHGRIDGPRRVTNGTGSRRQRAGPVRQHLVGDEPGRAHRTGPCLAANVRAEVRRGDAHGPGDPGRRAQRSGGRGGQHPAAPNPLRSTSDLTAGDGS
ncbi:FAD-dependent oxidoreductase [Streptomyces sp. NPDC057565]|uniref:FAD-dependent oxidoreductase n=1 Tax=Streptomyces sp. NPDC057565 TaxID=3346169 RepID=UPI00369B67F4